MLSESQYQADSLSTVLHLGPQDEVREHDCFSDFLLMCVLSKLKVLSESLCLAGNLVTVLHLGPQDEVHERDRFSDFLLTCLKEVLPRFKHLKVVLMSAALNIQLFTSYFNGCPVISGRSNIAAVLSCFFW